MNLIWNSWVMLVLAHILENNRTFSFFTLLFYLACTIVHMCKQNAYISEKLIIVVKFIYSSRVVLVVVIYVMASCASSRI